MWSTAADRAGLHLAVDSLSFHAGHYGETADALRHAELEAAHMPEESQDAVLSRFFTTRAASLLVSEQVRESRGAAEVALRHAPLRTVTWDAGSGCRPGSGAALLRRAVP
ncbi:hypothetical protein [Streptomyces sp. NPDC048332]|uniref:hypothetical protein n=1 Tax=Streptomyces sp. NPDC048332 TaxID=3154619 RepID=UPI00341B411C